MTFKFPSFFSLLSYLCINICIFFHTTFLYTLRSSKWNQCEKGQIQKYIILCLFPCCRICRRRTLCLWSSGSPESCRTAWRRPWFTMYIVFFLVFVLAKNEGRAENYMVLIMNILHIAKCTLCSSTQYKEQYNTQWRTSTMYIPDNVLVSAGGSSNVHGCIGRRTLPENLKLAIRQEFLHLLQKRRKVGFKDKQTIFLAPSPPIISINFE